MARRHLWLLRALSRPDAPVAPRIFARPEFASPSLGGDRGQRFSGGANGLARAGRNRGIADRLLRYRFFCLHLWTGAALVFDRLSRSLFHRECGGKSRSKNHRFRAVSLRSTSILYGRAFSIPRLWFLSGQLVVDPVSHGANHRRVSVADSDRGSRVARSARRRLPRIHAGNPSPRAVALLMSCLGQAGRADAPPWQLERLFCNILARVF